MTIGRACLLVVLAVAVYGTVAALRGAHGGRPELVDSARRACYVLAGLALLLMGILELAYWRDDFHYELVAGNSSTTTPLYYKLTAVWSSQAGSLLLWFLVLSVTASVALHTGRRRCREALPYATAVLCGIAAFFAFVMVVYANPFEPASPAPVEGNGLQPLLRYPLMALHPVALYLGYAGAAVPFAFAVGALASGRLDAGWLAAVRRYALAAWTFLAAGLILGSRWSYAELGWGGYWGWDAVENVALMPWLTATAFLHSTLVQEKRGMLKVWNVVLVIATFALSLLGTFLVRSGILDSIHAFGASTLGVPFLVFIAVTLAGSLTLVAWRLPELRSSGRLDSLLSREAIFLLNNLVLVALCFVIFWGTFFPLISEALTGTRSRVGPPWFERYTTPLAIVLVLLSGLGPLLAWRKVTAHGMARVMAWPVVAAVGTGIAVAALSSAPERPAALIAFVLIAFAVAAVAQEFWRGARARARAPGERRPLALVRLVGRNRRRYGGYVVHLGFAALLLGVAASSSFATQADHRLGVGDSARVAGYDVRYARATSTMSNEKITFGAVLDVRRDGRAVTTLRPSREYYPSQDPSLGAIGRFFDGEATSEIGLRATLGKDIWISMEPDVSTLRRPIDEADRRFGDVPSNVQALLIASLVQRYENQAPPATFRMIVRSGVTWIWIGSLVVGVGALISLWPAPTRRRARAPVAVSAAPSPAPESSPS